MSNMIKRIVSVCLAIMLLVPSMSVYGLDEPYDCEVNGHAWGEWIVIDESSCHYEGQKERECTVCGEKDVQSIPMTAHKWGEWIDEESPDCYNVGSKYRVCEICDDTQECEIPMLGHKWSSWKVTKKATHHVYGSKCRTCSRCCKKETKRIAKRAYTKNEKKALATTKKFLKEYKNYNINKAKSYQSKKVIGFWFWKNNKFYPAVKKVFKSKFKYSVVNVYPSRKYIKIKVKQTYPDAYDATNAAIEDAYAYYCRYPYITQNKFDNYLMSRISYRIKRGETVQKSVYVTFTLKNTKKGWKICKMQNGKHVATMRIDTALKEW